MKKFLAYEARAKNEIIMDDLIVEAENTNEAAIKVLKNLGYEIDELVSLEKAEKEFNNRQKGNKTKCGLR